VLVRVAGAGVCFRASASLRVSATRKRYLVMYSDLVIVGPAGLAGARIGDLFCLLSFVHFARFVSWSRAHRFKWNRRVEGSPSPSQSEEAVSLVWMSSLSLDN